MPFDQLQGSDKEKLDALCQRSYKGQAIWFLNGFWEQHGKDNAEDIWSWVHTFSKLDLDRQEDGCGLDELNAHRFLEQIGSTHTVKELREGLRQSKAIGESERPKLVPITHFLVYKFGVDWQELVNSIQGGDPVEIAEAESKLREVQQAFQEAEARASEARLALVEAQNRENEAKAREAEAKQREAEAVAAAEEARAREADALAREAEAREAEAPFKAAQEELEAAVAELKAQEDAYNAKTAELKAKGEGSGVAAMRAKNELAQHLSEDPLPLRRAKITQEAALKKAEKFRAPFEAATKQAEAARLTATTAREASDEARRQAESSARSAEAARAQAEKSRQHAEETKVAADQAMQHARDAVADAEAYLEEIKSRMPNGQIWWMERELHEAKAYLPQAKGGYKKNAI